MAHPKRRTSKHKKRVRRSHLALGLEVANHCPRCGAPTKSHTVCEGCGYYGFEKGGSKGTEVLQKDDF